MSAGDKKVVEWVRDELTRSGISTSHLDDDAMLIVVNAMQRAANHSGVLALSDAVRGVIAIHASFH